MAVSSTFLEQNILIGRVFFWVRCLRFILYHRNLSIAINKMTTIDFFWLFLFVMLAIEIELLFDNVISSTDTGCFE